MRALIGGVGPDWDLREIDLPTMQIGGARIQVMAAALNRADLYALQGTYRAAGQTGDVYTAGMEVAGIVEIGSPIAPHLPAGTRVMGVTAGAFADHALCDPRLLVPIPDGMSFEEAARRQRLLPPRTTRRQPPRATGDHRYGAPGGP